MTEILSPGASCVVPEALGGLPVTEFSDRAFAQSPVQEVFLPESLIRIGRYCFYGCESLRSLHVYAKTTEIGGGVFNGCRNVREIFFHMGENERSALRDFVTELNERITVHYFLPAADGGEKEAARLVFPIYYDEAVENTPARITVSNIHGTGQKYRYCFDDKKVRFDKYDRLFVYEKAEETVLLAAEVAVWRLQYPHGLWTTAKREYESFLRENLYEILMGNMKEEDTFKWLVREFLEDGSQTGRLPDEMSGASGERESRLPPEKRTGLSPEEMDRLISEASRQKKAELSGLLMDIKHRRLPQKKKKFEF